MMLTSGTQLSGNFSLPCVAQPLHTNFIYSSVRTPPDNRQNADTTLFPDAKAQTWAVGTALCGTRSTLSCMSRPEHSRHLPLTANPVLQIRSCRISVPQPCAVGVLCMITVPSNSTNLKTGASELPPLPWGHIHTQPHTPGFYREQPVSWALHFLTAEMGEVTQVDFTLAVCGTGASTPAGQTLYMESLSNPAPQPRTVSLQVSSQPRDWEAVLSRRILRLLSTSL